METYSEKMKNTCEGAGLYIDSRYSSVIPTEYSRFDLYETLELTKVNGVRLTFQIGSQCAWVYVGWGLISKSLGPNKLSFISDIRI